MHLDDAIIYFISMRNYLMVPNVEKWVFDLFHVNVLTTTNAFLEVLTARISNGQIKELQFCLQNLKEFQLLTRTVCNINLYDAVSFLRTCPHLERLFINLSSYSMNCVPYEKLHQRHLFEEFNHIFNPLKIIKLMGVEFREYEIDLIRLLLRKAICLETLVLTTYPPHALFGISHFHSWKTSVNCRILVFNQLNDKSGIHPKEKRFACYT
ncbi:F-box domain-containing protein/FBD domain-containing protein [Quillaja saponaria]|nr:F-box domain-containing protein/FBD domain-containing protein [Quillaja saponaria]